MDSGQTIAIALITGLVTSIHCMAMCGPLACAMARANASETQKLVTYTSYHIGRLISYGSIGTLCGALGEQPLRWIFQTPAVILPWALVGVFLVTALGLWKRLPRPRVIDQVVVRVRMRSLRLTVGRGALVMGLLTPLLPCGPLYLLFASALLSGNALLGAEFAIAFGVGTVPLLWVAQCSLLKIQKRIPALRFQQIQRFLAVIAALVMIWRLQDTLPQLAAMGDEKVLSENSELPNCCH